MKNKFPEELKEEITTYLAEIKVDLENYLAWVMEEVNSANYNLRAAEVVFGYDLVDSSFRLRGRPAFGRAHLPCLTKQKWISSASLPQARASSARWTVPGWEPTGRPGNPAPRLPCRDRLSG